MRTMKPSYFCSGMSYMCINVTSIDISTTAKVVQNSIVEETEPYRSCFSLPIALCSLLHNCIVRTFPIPHCILFFFQIHEGSLHHTFLQVLLYHRQNVRVKIWSRHLSLLWNHPIFHAGLLMYGNILWRVKYVYCVSQGWQVVLQLYYIF